MKSGSTLTYLHGDHLGSTVLETNSSGTVTTDERYYAYGKQRDSGKVVTDNRFTGQKEDASGLQYFNARYYDPQTGLFVSPDTIVPDAGNVFAYNRSMYVLGRVMNANDPSGHAANDKAITAGDGAGTTRIGFFSDDRFLCSQGTCVSNESALAQDTAALLLIKEMTSNSKNVAMLMAMVGGVEVEPVLESGPVFEVSPNTGSTNSAASRIGIRGAKPGEGSAGGPTAGKSITKAMRLSDLEANKNANPSGNYQCTNCGYENTDPSHFDIDHIVAKSQNGNTEPVNRRVLCRGCNRSAQEGWPPLPGSDWASKHPDWDMRPE